jgi:hypothetical protein
MVFVTVVESVYSAVRTDTLYKAGFYNWWKVYTARCGLIPYIKQGYIAAVESVYSAVRTDTLYKAGFYNWWKVFIARYELIPYIKQVFITGGKCLQRGAD